MLLRDNLQPTDFADAEVRVSRWVETAALPSWADSTVSAYRVWECRCTHYWFQRHEWMKVGANASDMDGWIFAGYFPRRQFSPHMTTAPNLEDV